MNEKMKKWNIPMLSYEDHPWAKVEGQVLSHPDILLY